ncbi:unnamed protein product [Oppiella nova]|uniref:Splicing factor 45 n=1 Tax=Oppiella nova TaxID=334625 RepID=A0A7R9QTG1_9ACAR|nr:unnamed protein product [Oppiella nova]CAG2174260.1 unnamed protein product [Oppiella nova]
MSLYDDVLIADSDDNQNDGWAPQTSGRRLLAQHLQNKTKANQSKAKPIRREPSSAPKPLEVPLAAIAAIASMQYGSKGSLLGGEWAVNEEYDPIWPNDYEKAREDRREKRHKERKPAAKRALGLDYDDDDDDDPSPPEDDKRAVRVGAAIGSSLFVFLCLPFTLSLSLSLSSTAPPPSLLETPPPSAAGGASVAAKIMARMGYKEGQGLGREEQGISSALSVEKTSKRGGVIVAETPVTSPVESITEIMKTPSKVVQLRNMVASGEVDDLLEDETKEECGKYGEVVRVVIFEVTEADEEFPVRIFVEFRRMESAIKAVVDLNGRYFGGRVVRANFFDVEKFKRLELKE